MTHIADENSAKLITFPSGTLYDPRALFRFSQAEALGKKNFEKKVPESLDEFKEQCRSVIGEPRKPAKWVEPGGDGRSGGKAKVGVERWKKCSSVVLKNSNTNGRGYAERTEPERVWLDLEYFKEEGGIIPKIPKNTDQHPQNSLLTTEIFTLKSLGMWKKADNITIKQYSGESEALRRLHYFTRQDTSRV